MTERGNANRSLSDEQRQTASEEGDDYWRIDDAHIGGDQSHIEDSFDSWSGSYENPEDLLERTPVHPYENVGRRFETHDIDEALGQVGQLSSGTVTPDDNDATYSSLRFSDSLEPSEEQRSTLPIHQLEASTTHTIDILGSLCLRSYSENSPSLEDQGIYQGLMMSRDHREIMGVFPNAICMTVNLEQRQAELEGLSARVMRNIDIVPRTPFDLDTKTKKHQKRYSVPVVNAPPMIRRSRSPSPSPTAIRFPNARPSMVTYIENILRPPPLPPLDESLPVKERKRYRVIESLIESEAAYLTSLNIAVKVYQNPLLAASVSTPLMDKDQIKRLFGPVESLMVHHELFFVALTQRTRDWAPEKDIGDLFLSSFHRTEVRRNYSEYVNNFTSAMSILEKGIKKKQRFVGFLRQQMAKSSTSLSLQALLLKPIQRFAHYKLFLQDLIKFTPVSHHDRIVLQMALVNIEQIAEYLNEAKRNSEQKSIVQHLQTHIVKLPMKLADSCSMLVKHSVIKLVKSSSGKIVMKERRLLLLDKLVICAAIKEGKRLKEEAEQVLGDITTQCLVYKWHCSVADLIITDADHTNQEISLEVIGRDNPQIKTKFLELTADMKHLDNDFQLLTKVSALVSLLHKEYEGLSQQQIDNHVNILQRKLNSGKELMQNCEAGRLDIMVPNREVHSLSRQLYTLVFMSEKEKQDWLKSLHFIKLKQHSPNSLTWLQGDNYDEEEEVEEDAKHGKNVFKSIAPMMQLPLVVDYYRLNQNMIDPSVECATCVGTNQVWVASGTNQSGQVTVIQCLSPAPIIIKTFPVESNRILCMKAVRSWSGSKGDNPSTVVWIGSRAGGLVIYDATSTECLASTRLSDSVLCIEKYGSRVFVGVADGNLLVFTVPKDGKWNLAEFKMIPVSKNSIQCMCTVGSRLWMGVRNSCVVLNMSTLHLECGIKVVDDPDVSVRRMTSAGSGVWVALNRKATLYLFHKDSHKSIQEIDIRSSLQKIIQYSGIKSNFDSLNSLRLTSLMASAGFLWVGTSQGAILLYRIPRPELKGLPIITSKPFLAGDGHKQSVRFLIAMQTKLDISTSRFDQFLLNEKQGMVPVSSVSSQMSSSNQPVEELPPQQDHLQCAFPQDTGAPPSSPSLLLSTRVDDSAPPPVSMIIQKLELQKKGPLPPTSPPVGEYRLLSSSEKLPESETQMEAIEEQAEAVKESTVTTDRSHSPSDYQNPGEILDKYPQTLDHAEPPIYDVVPYEFDYSDGEGNEDEKGELMEGGNEARQQEGDSERREEEAIVGRDEVRSKGNNEPIKATESDDIDPSRYHNVLSSRENKGTLYSQLDTAVSTMRSETGDQLHIDGAMFVFSGGMGINNFRSKNGSSPLLQPKKRNSIAFGDDNVDNIPCVISYQIPDVLF